MGMPNIDLVTSRMSHQLPFYMAWTPDPGNKATDALVRKLPYAFPPFSLISWVLAEKRNDENDIDNYNMKNCRHGTPCC